MSEQSHLFPADDENSQPRNSSGDCPDPPGGGADGGGVYLWGLGLLGRSVSSTHCQTSCDLSPSSPGSCSAPAPSLAARLGSVALPLRLGRVPPLLPLWGTKTTAPYLSGTPPPDRWEVVGTHASATLSPLPGYKMPVTSDPTSHLPRAMVRRGAPLGQSSPPATYLNCSTGPGSGALGWLLHLE